MNPLLKGTRYVYCGGDEGREGGYCFEAWPTHRRCLSIPDEGMTEILSDVFAAVYTCILCGLMNCRGISENQVIE